MKNLAEAAFGEFGAFFTKDCTFFQRSVEEHKYLNISTYTLPEKG